MPNIHFLTGARPRPSAPRLGPTHTEPVAGHAFSLQPPSPPAAAAAEPFETPCGRPLRVAGVGAALPSPQALSARERRALGLAAAEPSRRHVGAQLGAAQTLAQTDSFGPSVPTANFDGHPVQVRRVLFRSASFPLERSSQARQRSPQQAAKQPQQPPRKRQRSSPGPQAGGASPHAMQQALTPTMGPALWPLPASGPGRRSLSDCSMEGYKASSHDDLDVQLASLRLDDSPPPSPMGHDALATGDTLPLRSDWSGNGPCNLLRKRKRSPSV